MKLHLTTTQSVVIQEIEKHGHVWAVGGAIRDLLLKKTPKDIDLATDLLPGEVADVIRTLGLIRIPDTKAFEHGIVRVVDRDTGELIDIATLRCDDNCDGRHAEVSFTEDILKDLARRDFTINAMAAKLDPEGEISYIEDPFHGHLACRDDGYIEAVGDAEARIQEDYLRMIRACRFCALGTGWELRKSLREAIKKHAHKIKEVSNERIRDEILKAHKYDRPGNFWRSLDECELLPHILPAMSNAVEQEGGEYHNETVFEHLTASADAAAELTTNPLLRLSCALHDIGKPKVAAKGSDGRVHFYKHEVEGASLAYQWLMEMRFSKKEAEYISSLIRHHQWRFESNSKSRTIRRWLQTVGPHWKDLITLRCADRKGNYAKRDKPMITSKMRELILKAEAIIESGVPIFKEDLAINGDDIKAVGVHPGPVYKEIFANLLGIVLNDPSKNDSAWLKAYVRKQYVEKKNGPEDTA